MLQRSSNCQVPGFVLASQCGETRNILEPGRNDLPSIAAANELFVGWQNQQRIARQ